MPVPKVIIDWGIKLQPQELNIKERAIAIANALMGKF